MCAHPVPVQLPASVGEMKADDPMYVCSIHGCFDNLKKCLIRSAAVCRAAACSSLEVYVTAVTNCLCWKGESTYNGVMGLS